MREMERSCGLGAVSVALRVTGDSKKGTALFMHAQLEELFNTNRIYTSKVSFSSSPVVIL